MVGCQRRGLGRLSSGGSRGLRCGRRVDLLGIVVAVAGAFVDALARDAASAFDIGPTVVWGLYGLFYLTVIGSILTGPVGLVWGLVTRLAVGRAPATDPPVARPARHPGAAPSAP